jgi:hypothetical protein
LGAFHSTEWTGWESIATEQFERPPIDAGISASLLLDIGPQYALTRDFG